MTSCVCECVSASVRPSLPKSQLIINQPNDVRSSQNFQDKFLRDSLDDPTCQGWPHPPSLQSGTFSILQVWLQGWGVLDTLLIVLESWNLARKSRITYHDDLWCQKLPHLPSIQSGREVLDFLLIMLESWNVSQIMSYLYQIFRIGSWWSSKLQIYGGWYPPSATRCLVFF